MLQLRLGDAALRQQNQSKRYAVLVFPSIARNIRLDQFPPYCRID